MVCKIGGGAYGQVWMALSVTGAHRAIKIVSREDFRFETTFEREFEGIKHFEPISRAHPGLVDVLHVGRSYEEGFYYYVMELADDLRAGPGVFDPYSYEPRTLRSDVLSGNPIDVSASINVGTVLADALHYLHDHGLAHRDVKPSNVIFVDGHPKLADIGLVAETGQQVHVGTEGFVPPEGTGTPQADIYSLGMVLYELTTGKDRLDFPELPDELPIDPAERASWQALNAITCKCCSAESSRRYETAADLTHALESIQQDHPPLWQRFLANPYARSAAAALLIFAIVIPVVVSTLRSKASGNSANDRGALSQRTDRRAVFDASTNEPPSVLPHRDQVSRVVTSTASNAYVYSKDGREIGALPLSLQKLVMLPEEEVPVEAPGYSQKSVRIAKLLTSPAAQNNEMGIALSRSPDNQQGWTSPLGIVFRYEISKRRHLSIWPITSTVFENFRRDALPSNLGQDHLAEIEASSLFPSPELTDERFVITTEGIAEKFCAWLAADPDRKGALRRDQVYRPVLRPVFAGRGYGSSLQLVYCEIVELTERASAKDSRETMKRG